MRDVTIVVTGMHCASCGLLIDDYLLDTAGVVSAVTDVKSGLCVVSVEDAIADDLLLAAVRDAGYLGQIR